MWGPHLHSSSISPGGSASLSFLSTNKQQNSQKEQGEGRTATGLSFSSLSLSLSLSLALALSSSSSPSNGCSSVLTSLSPTVELGDESASFFPFCIHPTPHTRLTPSIITFRPDSIRLDSPRFRLISQHRFF
ncbi:hypothetical protein LY76DRAFT_377328 [Colletotrichum caudatum]|nr:hypothetical protein LY76DRAFT_377328 [Colletotrichum caudatum]